METKFKKSGIVCLDCRKKWSSEWFTKLRMSQTPKERSEFSAWARAQMKTDPSKVVRKQWRTIRANPVLREKKYKKLKQQAIDFWKNVSPEEKERILRAWLGAKSRSKVSDELKDGMIKEGFYKGFKSEQYFHGFFPDEINHELKTIVEMYGDLYHCNPRKYKDSDLFLKTIGRTVGDQWERDRRRLACFYKHGYKVIIVWEGDFRRDPKLQLERIRTILA